MSGTAFTFDWTITTNADSSGTLAAPVVTVTVANSLCVVGVSASTIGITGSTTNIVPTVVKTDSEYTITWALTDLSGGQSYSVPAVVTTNEYYCTDQQAIPVTATVTDSSGDVLTANNGDPLVFTTTTGDPTITTTTLDMLGAYNPPVTTSYGGVSTDGGATVGTSPGQAAVVQFTFYDSWTTAADRGQRYFASITVTDTLPDGANFDPALNPGWVQVAGTNTVTFTVTAPAGGYLDPVDFMNVTKGLALNLTFPGAPTNQKLTNTVSITAVPINPGVNEKAYTGSGSLDFKLLAEWDPHGVFDKYGITTVFDVQESRALGASYRVEVQNVASDTGMPFNVSDYSALSTTLPSNDVAGQDLDSRLYFDSLTFRAFYTVYAGLTTNWVGQVDILTCLNNGPATVVATITTPSDTLPGDDVQVPLPNGPSITCLQVKSHDAAGIPGGLALTWDVNVKFRDPSATVITDGKQVKLYNTAYLNATWADGRGTLTGSATSYDWVNPYAPWVETNKFVTKAGNLQMTDGAPVVPGDKVNWQIFNAVHDCAPGLTNFDTMSIVDLLPPGFQYVPGSTFGDWYASNSAPVVYLTQDPTITNNFHNSGRQALVWQVGQTLCDSDSDLALPITLRFDTLVTDQIQQGVNTNYGYTTWTGGDGVVPYTLSSLPDTYDVNNNGSTTDIVSGEGATVTYVPPKALLTSLTVQGSLDSSYLVTPQYGTSTADAPAVNYQLTLDNNSVQDITSLTTIDALPYVGDTTLSPNTTGQVTARNSQFAVQLTGPVVPPSAAYTVMYTTSPVAGKTAAQLNNGATWTASPSDWSAVTAFKIVLNAGQVLPQGQSDEFTVPATIPDAAAAAGQFAYNSFATSTDSAAANWAESNLSGVTIYSATPPPPPPPPTSPTTNTPPTTTTTTTPPTSTTTTSAPPAGNAAPGGATTGGGVTTSRSAAPAVLIVAMGLTLAVVTLRRRLSTRNVAA